MRYAAFISYSHADSRWAQWIQRSLEHYRIPKKLVAKHGFGKNRLGSIFLDRDELSSSSSLSSSITAALESSENLIVVCSPASAASRWVNEEIRTFQALGRGDNIYCLIVDGNEGEYFPPNLLKDEPLGVDVRPQADGKQNAKLKIIASLLDIPFATLKDREQIRRTRLFATATGSAVVLAGIMTILAINAVMSGREAEHNRMLATDALKDAEAVSQFLATMLVEIDPEAMGNTIVQEIADKQPSSEFPGDVNSTDLARKLLDKHILKKATDAVATQFVEQPGISARLSSALGDSYHAIGMYDKAIERFSTSQTQYNQEFGATDPRTIKAQTSLAMSMLYEGRLDDAALMYENAVHSGRENLGDQHETTLAAMNGLAMTYADMTRLEESLELLEELSVLMIQTKGRENLHTIDVNANLGWTLYQLGDYQRAESITAEQYRLRIETLGPEAYETMTLLNNLALIYGKTGRLQEAEKAHREEWQISQRTMGMNHPEVLISMLNLGRVLGKQGKHAEAFELLEDALIRADQVLPPVHPLLAAINTACGEMALELGDKQKAHSLFLRTQSIYQQLFEPGHSRFDRLNELLAMSQG